MISPHFFVCAAGRQYKLLGAVVWAPLCGTSHWLYYKLNLGPTLETWLVDQGLLDKTPSDNYTRTPLTEGAAAEGKAEQQQPLQQQQQGEQQRDETQQQQGEAPRTVESLTWREKRAFAEEVRRREMEELHKWMEGGGVPAEAPWEAARRATQQQQQEQQGGGEVGESKRPSRWWRFW